MFKNYLKTTIRNLWKNKIYGFLNIFGLAIGITCAGLIFLWVENEYSYDHYNTKKDYLYWIRENQAYNGKIYTFNATPGLMSPAMKAEIPGLENTARCTWEQSVLFSLGDKSIYETGGFTDSALFSMFTIPFLQGNSRTAFNQLHSVVISEKMAKKFFGENKDVVGKTIKVDNREDYMISGVFKDFPDNSSIKLDWFAPFQIYLDKNRWLNNWGSNGIRTYVQLKPTTTIASINKILYGYIQKRAPQAVARPFLFSMNDWRLRNEFEDGKQTGGGRIEFVRMFTIIAWIILLIACINFMNLATARSEKRAREVGVRKVLGAEKKTLIAQFIGEAFFMSLLSVILAVGFMLLLLPSFNLLVEKQLILGLTNPSHILSLIAIAATCGLIAGSYPALYLSSFNPVFVFKGIKMKSGSASLIRKGLVIFQFTISIILIICTIIIFQQVQHVKDRDLGYNKDNLIQMEVQGDMGKHFAAIKDQLLATGAVEAASLSSLPMLEMGSNTDDYTWEGKDPDKKILITNDYVGPEYISTTKTKIIEGKDFQSEADSNKVIVNETLAKLITNGSAVGKILRADTNKFEIIGVVKNFVYGDMYGGSDPLLFVCYPQWSSFLYIRIKPTANKENAIAKIENVMKANNPGYPFDYKFVDSQFDELFKTESLISKLSRVFAMLAIIISCLGLFGLAAYTAERRTREIGIRKVLGASVPGIAGLLSKDFLRLVVISSIIAFPFSWWAMHKWLQNYAYRIEINWWVFVLAGVLAILIAVITISSQAIRAALMNPVRSLRSE
ncbi:MAG: ABC transporter permease [Bacteroidetes bacterium]|nr:ABC transporter permease [Bacteroidota bacterium]